MDINVNYHSSIRIGTVYVDPYKIKDSINDASYVFITHSHYDHFSFSDIDKVVGDNTIFVCPFDVCKELEKRYSNKIICVVPNESYEFEDISFLTFPSYNIFAQFHPFANKWVGYVIEYEGIKYAILGDTDLVEEIKSIECDVLFVPIGGKYTMDAEDGAALVNIIKPKLVVPVHYNGVVGSKEDEVKFLKYLNKGIKYKIFC